MKAALKEKPSVGMKSDRRLSLPVNDRHLEYGDRLRLPPTVRESKNDRSMNKDDSDDEPKSDMSVRVRRRRTYSTPDADLCVPEIVIEEAPSIGSGTDFNTHHAAAVASLRQLSRLTFKMDHLRIGDMLAEHLNEKEQKTTAAILKRHELANEHIAKPASSPMGNRRRSTPNLKSVEEEEDADE